MEPEFNKNSTQHRLPNTLAFAKCEYFEIEKMLIWSIFKSIKQAQQKSIQRVVPSTTIINDKTNMASFSLPAGEEAKAWAEVVKDTKNNVY